MSNILVWLHPLMQSIAALLGLWATWQGWKRVQMLRGKKILFPWKLHVRLGVWALALWSLGGLGFYVTHSLFGATHVTGLHAELFWPILALSLFGLGSGYVMNRYKKKRVWLPVAHGLSNAVLMLLVLAECWTGAGLLDQFL